MAKRKQYPLRIDADVWAGIERWAADDLRSVEGVVEVILSRALGVGGRGVGGVGAGGAPGGGRIPRAAPPGRGPPLPL